MSGLPVPRNAVYILTITPKVCRCDHENIVFATGRVLDRVIARAESYWAVWDGFYSDQLLWLEFLVVDTRDGRIMWANGAPAKESTDGEIAGTRQSRD